MKAKIVAIENGFRVITLERINGKVIDSSDFLTLPMAEEYKKKIEGTLKNNRAYL